MPEISIIIPSYNSGKHLTETIDSILAQTFRDIELIVVDDGSSDQTPALVKTYGASVRLIEQPNAGVCVARNRGLSEASGRFICFMDHDDYWFPEKLQRQLEVFKTHPEAGVVYSSFIEWHADEDGQFPAPSSFAPTDSPEAIDAEFSGWIYHLLLLDCWVLTSTAMIRAEVLEKCGGFDATLPFSEDWDLWLRIAQAFPIFKLQRPTTLYRQHRQQGNRVVRDVDYRTRLLTHAVEQWGLCSRDGRGLDRREFRERLAHYHASFAFTHLYSKSGKTGLALSAFLKAWCCAPYKLKYLVYIPAVLSGWRPK